MVAYMRLYLNLCNMSVTLLTSPSYTFAIDFTFSFVNPLRWVWQGLQLKRLHDFLDDPLSLETAITRGLRLLGCQAIQ